MNKKIWAKTAIVFGSVIGSIYVLFLLAPFVVSPLVNSYVPKINEEVQKATGLSTELNGFKLVTTPKLTIGAKVGEFILRTPENKEIMKADDFAVKMSLLPLLKKQIRVDLVTLKNLDMNLGLNKDGSFEIEKYFVTDNKEQETTKSDDENINPEALPFGLKLSNHLPDIRIGGYKLSFIDISSGKTYDIKGNKTEITDFVLDKHVKIIADGNATLSGREQFKYNLKIYNKIMPDVKVNDLVFNSQKQKEKTPQEDFKLNLLDVFKEIYNNKITANVNGDITLSNEGNNGYLKIDNMSVSPNGISIPPSNLDLLFKGHKININSDIYTAENEVTNVSGEVKTGKNTNIDIGIKSGAELSNIVRIINAIAMTFNIKDLQTLSANGKLDADFNIKSDLKKVNSNGYLKIPAAKINYGLYNVTIDNINADVALNNNNINIKNIGFAILGQPLKLYGIITENAEADLHLLAENLSLKGLIVACGQAELLKDNKVNSGLVNLKADVIGKLDNIKPTAKVILSNIDIKNVPADTVIKLPRTDIDIISDGKTFSGNAVSTNIKAIHPAATVNIPRLNAKIEEDVIIVNQTPTTVDHIKFNLSGKIKNYLTEKIGIDFVTTGDIKSTLKGDVNMAKQTLNLVFATTDTSKIIIPMFDKSKMEFYGNVNITGNLVNPILGGTINIPFISIPEVIVDMENLVAKLNGPILSGTATVGKFITGGIIAENIATDFLMKGDDFYLNNMKGNAFEGKFNGDIVYNMANAKTKVVFKGSDMNAEKAIAGAAGIANALSGKLSFDTNINLTVLPDYAAMMNTLGGKLNFKIEKGTFGNIGRLEHFFKAPNIVKYGILKNTVSTISNLAGFKNTAEFAFLSGSMTFSNGWANLENIKSTGASLSYFVTGKYNLVNGTTNVIILGRLNNKVVKLLGPLGELSADKILSYIPKLGDLTKAVAQTVTEDPDKERISELPELTDTNPGHKDFKVIFNGNVESVGSVKSFKWLTKSDTSEMEQMTVSETIKSIKPAITTDVKNTVTSVKNTVSETKNTVKEIKSSVSEIKNLFKSVSKPQTQTTTSTSTTSTTTTTPATSATTETPAATTESVQTASSSSTTASKTETETVTQTNATTSEPAASAQGESAEAITE